MATGTTGSPGNIPYPVGSDRYALTSDLAGMASQTNLALVNAAWMKTGLAPGTDLNTLITPGVYGINTYAIAESLTNRPQLVAAVDRAALEVIPDGSGGVIQRWSTTKGASLPDSPKMERRRDTTGAWTGWERSDRDPTTGVPAGRAATAAHQAEDGVVSLLAGLTSDPDAPWLWRAGAGAKLTIPTPDGTGQATHPSVLYYPGGKFGWKYWMAMTPYAFSDEALEDPCVVVSNDGTTWQVPAGATNPIDDQPGKPGPHNSDTHLVELPDGRLMLSWRTVDRPNGNRNIIYRRVTSDGVTWTPTAEMITAPATGPHSTFVSQSIVRVGDLWRIYGITTGGTNQLCYIETALAVPTYVPWSTPTVCTVRGVASDREMWHSDVQYVNGQWWAIINDGAYNTSAVEGDIHVARSKDGITWDYSPTPLVPRVTADHDNLYKAGFVVGSGSLDVFFSAYTRDTLRWHIYRTTAAKAIPAPDITVPGVRVLDLGAEHLDTLLEPCEFRQSTDANASVANGYPDVRPSSPGSGWAGVGSVKRWGTAGQLIQTYQPRIGPAWVRDRYTSWSAWRVVTPTPAPTDWDAAIAALNAAAA